jgi:uncharacterized protein YkwD
MRAVLCLQRIERRRAGARTLRLRGSLDKAATSHARDMVRHRYFDHVSPTGSSPLSRAVAAGYRGHRRTTVGENLLSWPTRQTAREVVAKWMASPPHRHNILCRCFSDVGIALVRRSSSGGHGVTVVAEFGRRS